jgi:hypothetical protein
MEVLFMLKETALVIAIIGFVMGAVALWKTPTCCEKSGKDCNEGRDCPRRKN